MSGICLHPENCPKITQIELEVPLCDTDPYGIVNNSEYFNYFEIACMDYFKNCGIDIQKKIVSFPFILLSWDCKYISPLNVFDTMVIKTMIRIDTVNFIYTFSQVMYNKRTNIVIAKSSTIFEEISYS